MVGSIGKCARSLRDVKHTDFGTFGDLLCRYRAQDMSSLPVIRKRAQQIIVLFNIVRCYDYLTATVSYALQAGRLSFFRLRSVFSR